MALFGKNYSANQKESSAMLPDDDFLRQLPVSLPLGDRLRLETLVFSADVMESALERLKTCAALIQNPPIDRAKRIQLFSDCWTIVDQVHVARQMLKALTGDHGLADITTYLEKYETATLMRNCMDHLNSNIPNRTKIKCPGTPMFGVISYFRPYPDDFEAGVVRGEVMGDMVIITAGTPPGTGAIFSPISPVGLTIRLPVCGWRLEAFEKTLNLEDAVGDLTQLLRRFSDTTKQSFAECAERLSAEHAVPIEEASRPSHNGCLIMFLKLGFVVNKV